MTSRPGRFVGTVAVTTLVVIGAGCASSGGGHGAKATSSPTTVRGTSAVAGADAATSVPATGVARTKVEVKADVVYATASPAQTLTLTLPISDGSKAVPVVALFHPGAFSGGDATMENDYATALAKAGIAAASVNERLSGEAKFPAGAQDAKAAIRWLRAHAADYGIDPDRIGAWGQSAGGWFANMLGATGDQPTVFDDPSLGNARVSSQVAAVVSWFGPTDFATMDTQAHHGDHCSDSQTHRDAKSPESQWLGGAVATSPETNLTDIATYVAKAKNLPPWYLAHGDTDCLVPGGQSAELDAALENAGAPDVTYNVLRGAGHMDPAFDRTQLQPTIAFLRTALDD